MSDLLDLERGFELREEFKRAHPEITKKLLSKEYDFLRENEHLGDKICILCLGGSYAYGLNNPSSDLDIRGVAVNSKEEVLGLSNFEQFINRETDTTIYGVNKFIKLMMECNPNIIEMLYCRPEDYAYISDVGKLLIENREIFLSQRLGNSFGGYANAQLKRIENATARDRLSSLRKKEHISSGVQSALDNLTIQHSLEKYGDLNVHVNKETEEILLDMNYKNLPLGEWVDQMNTAKQVLQNYEHSLGRNKKKDDAHLNKHASHIFRLLTMGVEGLRDHKVDTYRTNDKQLLLDIKNGKYMQEDGILAPEFYEKVQELEEQLKYWKEHTTLPKSADFKKIEELVIKINQLSIKK